MSSASLPVNIPPAPDQQAPALEYSASKSYGRMVFDDTFKNNRARTGIAWIAVLVFMAVFAPFLANSHPILMKMDGRWSSPLLVHLTQTDVTLLIAFFAGIVLSIAWNITWPQRLAMLLWVVAVSLLLVWWPAMTQSSAQPTSKFVTTLVAMLVLLDLALVGWIPWALSLPARGKAILIGGMLPVALI